MEALDSQGQESNEEYLIYNYACRMCEFYKQEVERLFTLFSKKLVENGKLTSEQREQGIKHVTTELEVFFGIYSPTNDKTVKNCDAVIFPIKKPSIGYLYRIAGRTIRILLDSSSQEEQCLQFDVDTLERESSAA